MVVGPRDARPAGQNDRLDKTRMAQTFRVGVGIVVLNRADEALAFERLDARGAWQLPQGVCG